MSLHHFDARRFALHAKWPLAEFVEKVPHRTIEERYEDHGHDDPVSPERLDRILYSDPPFVYDGEANECESGVGCYNR